MIIVPVALAFVIWPEEASAAAWRLFGEDKRDGGCIWGDVGGDEHKPSLLREHECAILCL